MAAFEKEKACTTSRQGRAAQVLASQVGNSALYLATVVIRITSLCGLVTRSADRNGVGWRRGRGWLGRWSSGGSLLHFCL